MTKQDIKQKALALGAAVCGVGDVELLRGEPAQRNPFYILPKARSIIGFGLRIPRGLYRAMEEKRQYYNFVNLGVKYIDEDLAEIFLLKLGAYIEDAGYDACLQRSIPGFRIKGDDSANPEVNRVYQLRFASPVSPDKPAPDVILDYNRCAVVCGLGAPGWHDRVIAPKYGTFLRFVYILTDLPLEPDPPFAGALCDGCGKCRDACPGHAVSADGVDTWQCSVYYRGAHRDQPFMTDDFLRGDPERDAVLDGEKRFDRESAAAIYEKLRFLPPTHLGYVPCLCGRSCETVCYRHLKEVGRL